MPRHIWGRSLPAQIRLRSYGYYSLGAKGGGGVFYDWFVRENLPDVAYKNKNGVLRTVTNNHRYHPQFTIFDRNSSPDEEIDTLIALSLLDFKHD